MPLRRPRPAIVGAIAVALVIAAGVPVGLLVRQHREHDRLMTAATRFATAWQTGSLVGPEYSGLSGADVATKVATITAGLTPAKTDLPSAVDVLSVGDERDGRAIARLRVRWDLGQDRAWTYSTQALLRDTAGRWQVEWTPQVIHPALADGLVLTTARIRPPRAEVLGADGQVLVTARDVVKVGIQPRRALDRQATAAQVAAIVGVNGPALAQRVVAAAPDVFVDVITLRKADYDKLRDQLQPIPGTVFHRDQVPLAPTAIFARALLGSVGLATREIIDGSNGRVRVGDQTGLSGLQRAYDVQLSGSAGLIVKAVAEKGSAQKAPTTPLQEFPVVPGKPLRLTLDSQTQEAADTALAAAPLPAALVAVRASTGEVLAVANGGPNATGYNRALLGQYPPGSTFKIVSSLALLTQGVTPTTQVACPSSFTVSGKQFTNAEHEVLGTVPFSTDFAMSCNTAFVGSAEKVTNEQLRAAAASLGVGAQNTLGASAFLGSIPPADGPVEHAASMIGQAKVLMSPLSVALTSAAVAGGKHVPGRLVVDPAPDTAAAPGEDLPATQLEALRSLMRGVVTGGTGTALMTVPGAPVFGKTGTAEFGAANPPKTHAWFTGYQGDIAFAVVVEGGGFGAKAAAPLAAQFLTALATP